MTTEVDPRAGAPHTFEHSGRNWRCTDPAIPDTFRAELVAELMDARRAVAAANRADDDAARRAARARVQDAKVALGERGAPWWEALDDDALAARLESTIVALLRHRDGKTICPSDAARVVGGVEWRDAMDASRAVAFELQARGAVEVRSKGARVPSLDDARGPLRIAPIDVAPDGAREDRRAD